MGTFALVILAYASRIHVDYGDSPSIVPALRAARTEQPAVAEMPTHSFVQPATRLKP